MIKHFYSFGRHFKIFNAIFLNFNRFLNGTLQSPIVNRSSSMSAKKYGFHFLHIMSSNLVTYVAFRLLFSPIQCALADPLTLYFYLFALHILRDIAFLNLSSSFYLASCRSICSIRHYFCYYCFINGQLCNFEVLS